MKNLRRSFHIFCYRNRNKGIPNLMLYIVLGCAIVYVMGMFDNSNALYYMLCFDKQAILQGQIWRLFTYAFLYGSSNATLHDYGKILYTAFTLYCFYSFGRYAELSIGTFKFNLYFFSGIILQDIFCMITGTPAVIDYLKLSLLLVFATSCPNSNLYILGIIPMRAWVWVLINFGFTVYEVIALRAWFPHNLFPLVAILNFFLFFGNEFINIFPLSWRMKFSKKKPQKEPIQFTRPEPGPYAAKKPQTYTHRCTVCGRTDVSNPELEFRYCSRCNGYHCYCEEHINNHEHIE